MSGKPKINVLVPLEDDLMAKLTAACEVRLVDITAPRTELLAAIRDVQGVLLNPHVRADREFFAAAPNVRVLSTTSVGYDPFDIPEATKHGVVVCHTPGVLTNAVANLTMGFVFTLALRLFPNEAYVRSGGWARREVAPPLGMEIQGKTFGVIGFGRIGQEVTRRMQALGLRTLWYDVFDTPHPSAPKSEYRSLDQLLAESDFVSLHTNLDSGSRHLIGVAELAEDETDGLPDQHGSVAGWSMMWRSPALQTGVIAGAGLDVLESEPPDRRQPNLHPAECNLLSPHRFGRRSKPAAPCVNWPLRICSPSSPANAHQRRSIRKCWGKQQSIRNKTKRRRNQDYHERAR